MLVHEWVDETYLFITTACIYTVVELKILVSYTGSTLLKMAKIEAWQAYSLKHGISFSFEKEIFPVSVALYILQSLVSSFSVLLWRK
jgi:hypothetical protein